jgi:hypothetical protein
MSVLGVAVCVYSLVTRHWQRVLMVIALTGLPLSAQQIQIPSSSPGVTRPRVAASRGGNGAAPDSRKSAPGSARPQNNPPPPVQLLGSVPTASPAETFALSGNLAYSCDNNEISVINIANPASPQVVATAGASIILNSADIHCDIYNNTLAVFSDQSSTNVGDSPGFVAFSLSNPSQPTLIAASPINKRFFAQPLYLGNYAFVPTNTVGGNDGQYGDLLAIDLTNLSNPVLVGTLETPQIDSVYGGPYDVTGVTQASGRLLYLGGSSSTGFQNNGAGWLQTIDATNPAAMQIVGQLVITGTKQFGPVLIQGSVALGIGNSGGYIGNFNGGTFGNIVVATFDITDPRQPQVLSTTPTSYMVGPGSGATQIGTNLFAFAGVSDSNGNDVLLIVDITNPALPVFSSIPLSQPFTSMRAVGTTLYATLGSNGFAVYSIPGVTNTPPSSCPTFIDAMLVLDRGANIPSQAFINAETALESFIGTLKFPSDQVGVASFATSAAVNQALSNSAGPAINAFNSIVPGGGISYIGSGIAAAQGEFASPRHNPAATPVMVLISDGADSGAPNPSATRAAANAAKAGGIEIISVQYGTGPTALMQSIASSTANFYQVTQ